jgi:tricorn protease
MRKLSILLLLILLAGITSMVYAQDEARLLRFPAIHDNQIVFTYAGDLYTVAATGGIARRLTNHDGFNMFARFSPDGSHIAFTGQYDGNTEVYLMPSRGGVPVRLTYTATLTRDDVSDRMGPNNIVMGWKDNEQILIRSRRIEPNSFNGQLYLVSVNGGLPQQLPLYRGGFSSYAPDGTKLAMNRVFREFRTWKRYRGGQADDVWIYDFATQELTNITDNPAQDIIPMWAGNKIYFISDRYEIMNLFSYDLETGETTQHTEFTDFDIKYPSLGNNAIVFENGGYLYRFDLNTETHTRVPVYINEDFAVGRGGLISVDKNIHTYEIAPDGKRALFGARGDLFTVPAEHGNTRNLTGTPGVHERNPKWSPDGKWIAFISDETGEDEIYIMPQDGQGDPVQLTTDGDTYKYGVLWSPDSKKLMWSDKKLRLSFVNVETKAVTQVVQATAWEVTSASWSPDSRWIAYAKTEEKQFTTIYLYSVDSRQTYPVTDGWFASSQPAFSANGKYLFFVSSRNFSPVYSQTEWNHAYVDMAGIYLVTLTKDTESPLKPRSDEVKTGDDENAAAESDNAAGDVTVRVDPDGIMDRIVALPVPGSNYWSPVSVGDKLYYMRNGSRDERSKLMMFDLDKRSETELGEINGFEISADGKKMLVAQQGSYAIIDLPSARIDIKDRLTLSDMKVQLERRAEWRQIFNESWRQMRDFFYAPNLHGMDWEAIREQYRPLVDHVNHRADLTYVIGEMIGELNAGHAYVGGGDMPQPERIRTGLLGAQIEKDGQSGYFRITRILRGQNWDSARRSPLTEIGVDVDEGDYIIAIDGKSTDGMTDIYEALVDKADKQVTLRVNSQPRQQGSRETVVIPIASELDLYYYNWVQDNIDKVNEATDGRVGYIHIPDMGVTGLNEFVRNYYPQIRKEGLIIDVRGNGGGNVSPMIIERLQREIAMFTKARNAAVNLDPSAMHLGPKVALADEFSASDGDIFAYRFKHHNLGPVIGKRTWGGVVGIRGTLPLLDGGYLNRPEFSRFDVEATEWVMEGVGVEPDIYVDNHPGKQFEGIDEQLDKAIEVILEKLEEYPVAIPEPPPYPDKSRDQN